MLIEIHLLQNHSPGNPNRDDMGAPKSAYFGGRLRGRISSQCIKRSIRSFPEFQKELKDHLGLRTKFFPHLVGDRAQKSDILKADHLRIRQACTRIAESKEKKDKQAKSEDEKADPRTQTGQLIYLDPGHVDEFVARLERLKREMPKAYEFYLKPASGFKEVMQTVVDGRELDDKLKANIVKNAWVIAKLRLLQLTKFDGEEEAHVVPGIEGADPDLDMAEWIVGRLEALSLLEDQDSKKRLKDIQKAASRQEKEELQDAEPDKPTDYDKFEKQLLEPLKSNAVDIALFGRMTTSDAFEDVEACLEVAHAMSTNEMVREQDWFTAVDDLGQGAAAAHIGENQFTSCTYYKYFSLDWKAFADRLAGPEPTTAAQKSAGDLARKAVRALIHAAVHAIPTGKKKGNAHNNLPDAVLVEIKEKRIPTSYANAFLKPVAPPADSDLLTESIRGLGHYVGLVSAGYGLKPDRFWFDLHQEPLTFTRKGGENQPPKPETLAKSLPSFDALLKAVDKALGGTGGEK